MPNTIKLHRVLKAPAERVYRAFVDADALAKWLAPNGFVNTVHELDARVGGGFKMSFTNFSTGKRQPFSGTFLALTPGERVLYTDKFDDPGMPGEITTEATFRATAFGTEITIVQSGIPDIIPVEACYLGWQESLVLLGKLVEAEIPD